MKQYFDPADKSYGAVPDDADLPEGTVAVAAQPAGLFECHDEKGALVRDVARKADYEFGAERIERLHAIKYVEAVLIVAGVEFDGVLKQESALVKVPLADLAQAVIDNAQPLIARELERRRAKTEARQAG